ncbi:Gfo/Idh/MocA family protein [Rhodoferax aquaticus]|uniref:Gfo/Idh/MocA family oxidoreductase n=1 Tax=Rhodoferax aquaticus TaxID=2527691 RepID=A0A515EM13_9BURK|nr:Gfo/Idh/MocA family oxidoreductase [Rhodoferax aquaticus]QDL53698.1 Gfo/Idh/MocA family oxidoreductase [Rhodoferax aquaticus]
MRTLRGQTQGPVRLAVVGPGLMGKRHIELIAANAQCELVSIVAPEHASHEQFAHQLGIPLYHSIEAMLQSTALDGVIISSPNVFHAAQAALCIHAGIPVLVEKPISHSVESASQLVELADKKNAKVLIGHHRAHSPLLAAARDIIQSKELGNVVGIMGSALFYKPSSYFEAGPWRREIGGGPILINLIHEVGNFRSLCGEITAVQAITSSAIRKFPVEDTVAINFQFASGALGTFLLSDTAASSRSWEHTSQENKSYPATENGECYLVTGTRGSLSIPNMQLSYYEGERTWWTPLQQKIWPVERQDPLECQLNHFIKIIQGWENPLVTARDGFENLRITEAIKESSLSQKMVQLS